MVEPRHCLRVPRSVKFRLLWDLLGVDVATAGGAGMVAWSQMGVAEEALCRDSARSLAVGGECVMRSQAAKPLTQLLQGLWHSEL